MLYCDWCDGPIRDTYFATLAPGGNYTNGDPLRLRPRHFHTAYRYDDCEITYFCCMGKALRLLNGAGEFRLPDAGYEWRLVPCSEESSAYTNGYTEPVLGVTPLAELELDDATYRALTSRRVFTVEHAADLRGRGKVVSGLGGKRLARLDAALLERGLLGYTAEATR